MAVVKSLIVRAVIIYFIFSFFRAPQQPKTAPGATKGVQTPARNMFPEGTTMDLHVYLSESDSMSNFHISNLFWFEEGLNYGDWTAGPNKDGTYSIEKEVPITHSMKNNGSLFLFAFITRTGFSPDPNAKNYAHNQMSSVMKQLNRFVIQLFN